ncbi:Coenzyme A biosynthesis bifunctional protein CoaBC [Candidatus Entotheonellaceae bacterium PAL068K]
MVKLTVRSALGQRYANRCLVREPLQKRTCHTMSLHGKKTILAVTGSIAAFKALHVLRGLKRQGAVVDVVMTTHATHFLQPAALEAWSGHPVYVDIFAPLKSWDMEHIALAHGAELVLVVPATANVIAKLATGLADDLLSTLLVVIADRTPIFLAPAMNTHMYLNTVVQDHLATLRQRRVEVIEPHYGQLASRLEGEGVGRLAEPEEIIARVVSHFSSGRGQAAKAPE